MLKGHTDSYTPLQRLLWYYDNTYGFLLWLEVTRMRLQTFGNAQGCWIQVGPTYSVGADKFSLDTWYGYAITFNGTGGSGVTGLKACMVPLTGGTIATATVTASQFSPQALSGSTASSVASCAAAPHVGFTSQMPNDTRLRDIMIRNELLSDADIAKFFSYRGAT